MGMRRKTGITEREFRVRSDLKGIVYGFRDAYGMSWFDAHPGMEPTLSIDPVSEIDLMKWASKNGLSKPHPRCSAARWRMFIAKMRNPERYENAEVIP